MMSFIVIFGTLLFPIAVAKYCDERVCLSVSLSAKVSHEPHV